MNHLPRRAFLKLTGLTASGLAVIPPPPGDPSSPVGLGRVTDALVGLYTEPSFSSNRIAWLERDEILTLYEQIVADDGPQYNPFWYRTIDGYAHSGSLQLVQWQIQRPETSIPKRGALFEVSVPFTRAYRQADPTASPLYRLYYQSTAWVTDMVEGPEGRKWYELLDDLLRVNYYVRAEHLRRVQPEELTPISPDVPLEEKRIDVSLAEQELRAYEQGELVLRTRIATGNPSLQSDNGVPTATPAGRFYITKKMPLRHMGDGKLTANLEAYELPGVPWVSYFFETGVAFHGTYWHSDYGRPKSHGCVNMRCEEAKWLFRWSSPTIDADRMLKSGHGTAVAVF
jgi:hypothetical protein